MNYRGEPVSLRGGVSAAAGALAGALAAPAPVRWAAVIAGSAGAAAGYIDDHEESRFATAKGLHGHLSSLAHGRVTTGVLKIAVIGIGAGAGAALLGQPDRKIGDWAVRCVAIAGTANLINLLDLRPGRALKATALGAVIASRHASPVSAGLLGMIAGTIPSDLSGRTMLGDLGANAAGGVLGVALAAHPSRRVRAASAGAVTALILASEKVSFSRIIDQNPVLSTIDEWGR